MFNHQGEAYGGLSIFFPARSAVEGFLRIDEAAGEHCRYRYHPDNSPPYSSTRNFSVLAFTGQQCVCVCVCTAETEHLWVSVLLRMERERGGELL